MSKSFVFLLIILCEMGSIPGFTMESTYVAPLATNHFDVLKIVSQYLPIDPIIVDAGAYDGTDTRRMARLWPKGRVYGFEPVPELFITLSTTTRRLGKNVTIYQKALSDNVGHAIFYLSEFNRGPSRVSASSSLLPPKDHLKYHPEIVFPRSIEVETITLDEWARQEGVDHVDFLWLDMQGYELHMLKASEIAKTARAIWLEVEFEESYAGQYLFKDIQEWMELNGYRLGATDFNVERPEDYAGNALFLKNL